MGISRSTSGPGLQSGGRLHTGIWQSQTPFPCDSSFLQGDALKFGGLHSSDMSEFLVANPLHAIPSVRCS